MKNSAVRKCEITYKIILNQFLFNFNFIKVIRQIRYQSSNHYFRLCFITKVLSGALIKCFPINTFLARLSGIERRWFFLHPLARYQEVKQEKINVLFVVVWPSLTYLNRRFFLYPSQKETETSHTKTGELHILVNIRIV